MKQLFLTLVVLTFGGCASLHSPYDLSEWCHRVGSSRPGSIGPDASDPVRCERELEEDLADGTPRILYVPQDVVMVPVQAARFLWAFLGRTDPPF